MMKWATAVCALVAMATGMAYAQGDPYAQLRSYDFQDRAALAAIQREIVAASGAPAKLAPIEAKLLNVVKDRNASFGGRQEACKFLASIGTARSVPALAAMLKRDAKEADAARYALERIPGPEAGAVLRAALTSSSGRVRVGVINSLGVRRDPAAIAPLARLASGSDPETRSAALDALGGIGTDRAMSALQSARPRDAAAMRAMLRCASAMARAGKSVRLDKAYADLAGKGKPRYIRVAAVRGLASSGSAQWLNVALAAMKDADPYIQRSAASLIAQSRDAATTKKAVAAFGSAPADAQVALLAGWGERRERLAARTAASSAQSADPNVRASAIRAAGRIGDAASVPALADVAASTMAESGLAREALAEMPGDESAREILRLAREGKPAVRATLMAVIAERPGAPSLSALLTGMRDADASVAVAALRGLGASGGRTEVAPIAALLTGSTNDEVRDASGRAIVACVQRSDDRDGAVGPVIAALAGASREATAALLGVLAEIGGQRALTELTQATASEDPEVKRAAVRGLAETWADSAPLQSLISIAKNDSAPAVRVIALRGYIRLVGQDGGMPADAKVNALRLALEAASRPDEKRQAFGALRDCRIESAVALLANYLGDADLGTEAAEAVLDLAAPQKRNNRDLPAVTGSAVASALNEIVRKSTDAQIKERAQKLGGSQD